jgi:hypothetical protein
MTHIAKRAAACALITHDHEGSRAFTETFADIWTRGLFAHRVQVVFAQDAFDVIEA